MNEDEAAIRSHERDAEDSRAMMSHVIEFATASLKSAGIVHGGALVALLGLMVSDSAQLGLKMSILPTMIPFMAGLVSVTVASGTAYIAQYYYQQAAYKKEYSFEFPYVKDLPSKARYDRIGAFFHYVGFALVIFAYFLLIIGLYRVYKTFSVYMLSEAMKPIS